MPLQAMACRHCHHLRMTRSGRRVYRLAPFVLGHKPAPLILWWGLGCVGPEGLAEAISEMYADHDTYLGWAKAKLPEVR
jgi:hypothetical protein